MKKQYLLLGNALFLILCVLVCGFNFLQLKSDYLLKTKDYLASVTDYLDSELERSGLSETAINQVIDKTLTVFQDFDSSLRITVMNDNGNVLADSDFSLADLNNHRAREEVYGIISGDNVYISTRYSATENVDRIYYSVGAKNQPAIIRAAVSLNYLNTAKWNIVKHGVIIGLLILAFFNFIVLKSTKKLDEHVANNLQALAKIKSGELATRMHRDRYSYPELIEMSEKFNQTMEVLETNFTVLESEKTSLDAMVNSLMEPLVVVNKELQVVFANQYAKTLFKRDIDPKVTPYPFVLLTHENELDGICEKVMSSGETIRKEFVLMLTGGYRAFQVTISPVGSEHAVVLFNDFSLEYEARKLRSDFVANVTHELKTPLTSIRGFVETLRGRKDLEPDQTNNFLEIIDIEAARLERLINDILNLSDIERLKIDSGLENFDLVELVDECLVQLDEQASEKRINLIPGDEPVFLPVQANRDRIKQVLLNLLENAIKYNKEQGSVWIDLEREAEYVTIKVKDDGFGIDEQSVRRVFERFYRVDKSRSRSLGGTGLGLSIVKHIALLYDGEATVQSTPNLGTTFTVRLKI